MRAGSALTRYSAAHPRDKFFDQEVRERFRTTQVLVSTEWIVLHEHGHQGRNLLPGDQIVENHGCRNHFLVLIKRAIKKNQQAAFVSLRVVVRRRVNRDSSPSLQRLALDLLFFQLALPNTRQAFDPGLRRRTGKFHHRNKHHALQRHLTRVEGVRPGGAVFHHFRHPREIAPSGHLERPINLEAISEARIVGNPFRSIPEIGIRQAREPFIVVHRWQSTLQANPPRLVVAAPHERHPRLPCSPPMGSTSGP